MCLKTQYCFNAAHVQTWIVRRKLKLDKDKTNINVVGNTLQMRKNDLPSNIKID